MPTAHEPLGMYLHLARASQQRQRPLVRDKMLVLAGAIAAERGLRQVAACCRERVLSHNAGHLVGRYASFAEALQDERFQTYLKKLRRDFPLEKTEHILDSLGIQLAGERETYYTDHEYAASLLGLSTEELERRFGDTAQPAENGKSRQGAMPPAVLSSQPPAVKRSAWLRPLLLAAILLAGLSIVAVWFLL